MKSLKITLRLLLYSILTLAIISCNNDNNETKTMSITISTGEIGSISRAIKGTYTDITAISLDVADDNGRFYAKGKPFTKTGITDTWTVEVKNIPVGRTLAFTASAYNSGDVKIFNGNKSQLLTLQNARVSIGLFPESTDEVPSLPYVQEVNPKENGVILTIKDINATQVAYRIVANPRSVGFRKTSGDTSGDTDREITGMLTLDYDKKARIELTHIEYEEGTFIHKIILNNYIGGNLETTFMSNQNSGATVVIGIAPVVSGISFKKSSDTDLQIKLDVSDDKNTSNLKYSWSFIDNNSSSRASIEDNTINPVTISNFNNKTQGALIATITDEDNLSFTYTYNINRDQFKTFIEFNVSSTSVDHNKIYSHENITILFNKGILASTVTDDSIFISDGIRLVGGSFSFPEEHKVVFTPSEPWKAGKEYSLNITSHILIDDEGNSLGLPVIVEFTAHINRSCKTILENNSNATDGTYLIDPDDAGGDEPFDVYCDMSTDGGGWTLIMKDSKSTNTLKYSSSYWENDALLNESDLTLNQNDAKYKSYLSVPFTNIRGCMQNNSGDGMRCMTATVTKDNAKSLFSGAYINIGASQVSSYASIVNHSTSLKECSGAKYGFNIIGYDSQNSARWGMTANINSQPCGNGGSDDDYVIGWGTNEGQESPNSNIGGVGFFGLIDYPSHRVTQRNGFLWVR